MSRFTSSVLLSLVAVVSAGCLKPIARGPAPVSGTVTLDGQSIEGTRVTFIPIQPNPNGTLGPMAFGVCDVEGNFTLMLEEDNIEGATAGECLVMISTRQVERRTDAEGAEQQVEIRPERFPARVNVRSMLKFRVPEGGAKDVRFDVTTEEPPPGSSLGK